MNKLLVAGALAVVGIALTQQQAAAWTNGKLSMGLNWEWSSGGNSFLWGAYKDGQPPAPYGGMPYGGAPYGGAHYGAPYGGTQDFMMTPPSYVPPTPAPVPPPAKTGAAGPSLVPTIAGYPAYVPYQNVNYPRPYYYAYPYPYPYTWYGR